MRIISRINSLIRNSAITLKYLLVKDKWEKNNGRINRRAYSSYEDYLKHQKSKLDIVDGCRWLEDYDQKYKLELKRRLERNRIIKPGMNVLCLAARLGTEVKSFLDIGCFAVGLDLNPGKNNKYVVYGDFHDIQFQDKSIDVVFTNSIDHSFDLSKLFKEINRVLKNHGLLIIEVSGGEKTETKAGAFESMRWESIDNLTDKIENYGFKIIKKEKMFFPWEGEHIYLRKKSRNSKGISGSFAQEVSSR